MRSRISCAFTLETTNTCFLSRQQRIFCDLILSVLDVTENSLDDMAKANVLLLMVLAASATLCVTKSGSCNEQVFMCTYNCTHSYINLYDMFFYTCFKQVTTIEHLREDIFNIREAYAEAEEQLEKTKVGLEQCMASRQADLVKLCDFHACYSLLYLFLC